MRKEEEGEEKRGRGEGGERGRRRRSPHVLLTPLRSSVLTHHFSSFSRSCSLSLAYFLSQPLLSVSVCLPLLLSLSFFLSASFSHPPSFLCLFLCPLSLFCNSPVFFSYSHSIPYLSFPPPFLSRPPSIFLSLPLYLSSSLHHPPPHSSYADVR